jgi:hypothetical protein
LGSATSSRAAAVSFSRNGNVVSRFDGPCDRVAAELEAILDGIADAPDAGYGTNPAGIFSKRMKSSMFLPNSAA